MNVALIIPGSIWYAPYVRLYTKILDERGVQYSIISWNREGDDSKEGIQYNVLCSTGHKSANLFAYIGYVNFIKKKLRENKFDKLIVFGPQMTCLLSFFLLAKYRTNFIIDYRDLSIEQKFGFKQLFSMMLRFSKLNIISSPGFKSCLPKGDYIISHNFDLNSAIQAIDEDTQKVRLDIDEINVLTIGAIRDLSSNLEVVKSLGNKDKFALQFIGKGDAAADIAEYCKINNIRNVSFRGFYKKNEEASFIKESTFLNIFYPRIITHDTALSNRFYNSLIYKRPMIVTKNTTQGDYVEQYQVGVAAENCDTLCCDLKQFLDNDFEEYSKRCNDLLKVFIREQKEFENAVINFVS